MYIALYKGQQESFAWGKTDITDKAKEELLDAGNQVFDGKEVQVLQYHDLDCREYQV